MRQVGNRASDDKRHSAAEGKPDHAHPLMIGLCRKALVGEHRIERLVDLSRAILRRPVGTGMKWRDNDKAATSQRRDEIAMDEWAPSNPSVAVREQDNRKGCPASDGGIATYGYGTAALLVQILTQCGDNLTRANVMTQATNIKNFAADLALPGMTISTTPDDWRINKQFQMMRFDGQPWVLFGSIVTDEYKTN